MGNEGERYESRRGRNLSRGGFSATDCANAALDHSPELEIQTTLGRARTVDRTQVETRGKR